MSGTITISCECFSTIVIRLWTLGILSLKIQKYIPRLQQQFILISDYKWKNVNKMIQIFFKISQNKQSKQTYGQIIFYKKN